MTCTPTPLARSAARTQFAARAVARLHAAAGLGWLLASGALAHAARPVPFKLEYAVASEADGCPDEAGLRAAVAARLGYDPFASGEGRTISTRIRKVGPRFVSRIELRDAQGTVRGVRELEAATCADLAASTSFAMAVAIDPEQANAPHKDPPAPPPPAPVVTAPVPSPPPQAPPPQAPPPQPTPRVPWTPTVFVGVEGAALGPYASLAAGGALGASLRHGSFGFGVEARASLPSRASAGPGEVSTNVMGVSPAVCAFVGQAGLCAQVFLGAFQGAAEGVDAPDKKTTFFAAAGLRASYTLRPIAGSGFGLEPYLGADLVLTRTRVNFRGQEVWSTAPASLSLGLRLAYAFL